jgi:hypothetical protein
LCEVVYLPRTPDVSTSALKAELDRLRAVQSVLGQLKAEDLKGLIGVLERVVSLG